MSVGARASITTSGANGAERSNPTTAVPYAGSPGSSTVDTPARVSAVAVFISDSSLCLAIHDEQLEIDPVGAAPFMR